MSAGAAYPHAPRYARKDRMVAIDDSIVPKEYRPQEVEGVRNAVWPKEAETVSARRRLDDNVTLATRDVQSLFVMQHTRQSPAVVQRRVKQIENCWRDFKANAAAATETKSSSAPTPAPFDMRSLYGEHDVYANLTLRSIDLGGWQAHPCLYLKLVEQVRPRLIVEVGVWKGSTTLIFAEALRHYRSVWRGKVVAVDTWLGALEFWKKSEHDLTRDLKFVNGYPSVYYNFLSNVVHQGLQDQVVPFPSPSLMAAQYFRVMKPPVSIDILHLDGSHEYEDVAADLAAWWPVIRKGGVMIGDDYERGWPGVIRAVDEFKIREHVNVSFNDVKWIVTKPI